MTTSYTTTINTNKGRQSLPAVYVLALRVGTLTCCCPPLKEAQLPASCNLHLTWLAGWRRNGACTRCCSIPSIEPIQPASHLACRVEEKGRMHQVLQHPVYRANPLQAIANHLQNTLPPPPSAPSPAAVQQSQQQRRKTLKKQQQKKKKAAGGIGGEAEVEMEG